MCTIKAGHLSTRIARDPCGMRLVRKFDVEMSSVCVCVCEREREKEKKIKIHMSMYKTLYARLSVFGMLGFSIWLLVLTFVAPPSLS